MLVENVVVDYPKIPKRKNVQLQDVMFRLRKREVGPLIFVESILLSFVITYKPENRKA